MPKRIVAPFRSLVVPDTTPPRYQWDIKVPEGLEEKRGMQQIAKEWFLFLL